MMKKLILRSVGVLLGVFLLGSTAFASFYPSGGGTYRLQTSAGVSDAVINLSSFKEPVSNIPYTMTYLNSSIECGTLDPQTSKSEFISFTGITQNSDGSAQLTGVIRGLGRSYPYTASSTLASTHFGQSIFILSDAPCLFQQYGALQNNSVITGNWTAPDPSGSLSVANREYVDGKAFGGIGGASETATGTVQIATNLQAAASTLNGSLGRLVIPSSIATSTFNAATAANRVVITGVGGTIDPNFISLATSTTIGSTYAFDIGKNERVFTSTSNFAIPNGIHKMFIREVGAGGNGVNTGTCNSGAGAGGYSEGPVDVSATTTVQVVVGLQGSATTTSTFAQALFATAGATGSANTNNPGAAGGGQGGIGFGGTFNSTGATGQTCFNTSSGFNANGGVSLLGSFGTGAQGGANTGNPGVVIVQW